jgi:hypothetical protein
MSKTLLRHTLIKKIFLTCLLKPYLYGQISTKIYDKRDNFNFKIINFPNMCSKITAAQVPTAYFSMMFNIHKHISHLIFVLVPECGEYEICKKKNLRSISHQRPFFQCTIRSAVNHLQNLFNVKTVSWKLFKFYSRSKTTTITNFILDEIKRSISTVEFHVLLY